jgi:ATP-dependent DNA helicase RecG
MPHPEVMPMQEANLLVPNNFQAVYNSSESLRPIGLDSNGIRRMMQALIQYEAFKIQESLPLDVLQELKLMPKDMAMRQIHFPDRLDLMQQAQYRLKFEELFYLQMKLLRNKQLRIQSTPGIVFQKVGELFNTFFKQYLPFELTGAQKRVIKEIRVDFASGKQMNRLVQGDVGSGKTIVALMCMLLAIDNGYQAALMAPTEILAQQHFESISTLLAPMDITVSLWTGSTKKSKRKQLDIELREGRLNILIGTHALIEDAVQFKNLGFVVIDEQHRFGVAQRAKLRDKGQVAPHILVMTATPIPRTLAMSAYADLDVSIIDELPPGRIPVQTVALANTRRDEVITRIAHLCQQGSQVYWVCTLIDESEEIQAQSAQAAYELLTVNLPSCSLALLHSKVPQATKKSIMQAFKANQIQVLVATTVIEVGVDVPNASVMVIENAERLGLAQLHQLRGRVGRGSTASHCLLLYKAPLSAMAKERIEVMRQTDNGFLIAENDLQLRGPGEILGTKQTGGIGYRIADLSRDAGLLPEVIALSNQLLVDCPANAQHIINRWVGVASRFAYA